MNLQKPMPTHVNCALQQSLLNLFRCFRRLYVVLRMVCNATNFGLSQQYAGMGRKAINHARAILAKGDLSWIMLRFSPQLKPLKQALKQVRTNWTFWRCSTWPSRVSNLATRLLTAKSCGLRAYSHVFCLHSNDERSKDAPSHDGWWSEGLEPLLIAALPLRRFPVLEEL